MCASYKLKQIRLVHIFSIQHMISTVRQTFIFWRLPMTQTRRWRDRMGHILFSSNIIIKKRVTDNCVFSHWKKNTNIIYTFLTIVFLEGSIFPSPCLGPDSGNYGPQIWPQTCMPYKYIKICSKQAANETGKYVFFGQIHAQYMTTEMKKISGITQKYSFWTIS